MSTFAVTAEELVIEPHPNADALELAVVGAYRAVVRKGQYQTGDLAIYIPEAAILPDALIAELGLTGRLAGKAANRVKAIRLRGELSQGIVCNPAAVAGLDLRAAAAEAADFADFLGIIKWVPEIPAHMNGQVVPAPDMIRMFEVENVKRYPDVFTAGERVTATEKTHGTCTIFELDLTSDTVRVSSKGFSGKGLSLVEDPNNLYWRAIRVHDVEAKARALVARLAPGVVKLGLFGETFGAGVQDLAYGVASRNTPGFAIFDAFLVTRSQPGFYVDQDELATLAAEVGLAMMPRLYDGPYDYAALAAVAEGPTVLGAGVHLREGVVVRPAVERYDATLGGRAMVKFVSEAYLLRSGEATEFE